MNYPHFGSEMLTPVSLTNPISVGTGTVNTTGVDLSLSSSPYVGAQGEVIIIVQSGAITGTLDVKLADSADNSAWADVAGVSITQITTANQIQALKVPFEKLRKFIRLTHVVGGTSCVFGVSMLFGCKTTV